MKHILIIESDKKYISNYISNYISLSNNSEWTYECYIDTKIGIKRIFKNHYDIILIDSDISVKNNIDISKIFRLAVLSGRPILMVNHLNKISNYINIFNIFFRYFKNGINHNIRYIFNSDKIIQSVKTLLKVKLINPNYICNRLFVER